MVEVPVGAGTGSEAEGRYGIGTGPVVDVQSGVGVGAGSEGEGRVDAGTGSEGDGRVGIGTSWGMEGRYGGISIGPVVDVQAGIGTPVAVETWRTVDGTGTDSAEGWCRGPVSRP
ncbi:hypothetical protein [Streptomyces sp. NPDC058755]|uniref:hypothetical protein n=1 Tax=Streptomyces sp. NPDC058755 TaxID=3346624 RepID=UPI0036A8875F